MKKNDDRELEVVGAESQGTFGISMRNQAYIMEILCDTLYTDKVLAVLREYSANAWDAHRSAGKGDVPIKVVLPSLLSPTLLIRDYGPGLSEDELYTIYTQYGESTKRDTNDTVGMLGIGSKSGFAISDTFMVTSWHGGRKRVYVATLDETNVGKMSRLHDEECPEEETGIEVSIPIKPEDIPTFEQRALNLYTHFSPLPDINLDIPVAQTMGCKVGQFLTHDGDLSWGGTWHAVMGCIPYRLDPRSVEAELREVGVELKTLLATSGRLYFDIGSVQVSASREELKYSTKTKKIIAERFRDLLDFYIEEVLSALKDDQVSCWEKRKKAIFVANRLELKLPGTLADWAQKRVRIFKETPPTNFKLVQHYNSSASIDYLCPESNLGVLIQDTDKDLRGFHFANNQVLMIPKPGCKLEDAVEELEKCLVEIRMTGFPIGRLSTKSWQSPMIPTPPKKTRPVNVKHKVSTFVFQPGRSYEYPFSSYWQVEEREPLDTDVYVILRSFQPNLPDFYHVVGQDSAALTLLDMASSIPTIYGYKATDRNPEPKVKGIHYHKWRTEVLPSLLLSKTEHHRLLEQITLANACYPEDGGYRKASDIVHLMLKAELAEHRLGPDHFMSQILRDIEAARRMRSDKVSQCFQHILQVVSGHYQSKAHSRVVELQLRYPLLDSHRHSFFDSIDKLAEWLDYIQVMDRIRDQKGYTQSSLDIDESFVLVTPEEIDESEVTVTPLDDDGGESDDESGEMEMSA